MQKIKQTKKCRKIGPYILLKPIGKGSYSTVYQACTYLGGPLYAVKQISLQNCSAKQIERIHQQINVLSIIKHENIISMVDYKQTQKNLYLVFQHCKFTDLNIYIKNHYDGILPEQKVQRIMMQLKGAFRVIRKHKVVHRDLKLANILVTEDFEIKLADFGFAKLLEEDEFFKSYVGTPLTMAPQIWEKKKYNQKCDIWSLGIITYQMLFGYNPFFKHSEKLTNKQIFEAFSKQIQFPFQISDQAKDFVKRMLIINSNQRMGFPEFFQHPWLKDQGQIFKLSDILRKQALFLELTRSLCKSSKPGVQKQFILNNCQSILTYSLIQFTRNYLQNSLTTWVNIAKHIFDLKYPNQRLVFLALALLLDNLNRTIASPLTILINADKIITLPNYIQFRQLQTWPMSQYTKRLPNFVAKSKSNIEQYLQNEGKIEFNANEKQSSLYQLFINELRQQIYNSKDKSNLKIYLKIKQWSGSQICINTQSSILSEDALKILIRNLSLKTQYHQLCKKCSSMFKFVFVNDKSPFQIEMESLRQKILYQEE